MLVFFTMMQEPQGPCASHFRGSMITFRSTTFKRNLLY